MENSTVPISPAQMRAPSLTISQSVGLSVVILVFVLIVWVSFNKYMDLGRTYRNRRGYIYLKVSDLVPPAPPIGAQIPEPWSDIYVFNNPQGAPRNRRESWSTAPAEHGTPEQPEPTAVRLDSLFLMENSDQGVYVGLGGIPRDRGKYQRLTSLSVAGADTDFKLAVDGEMDTAQALHKGVCLIAMILFGEFGACLVVFAISVDSGSSLYADYVASFVLILAIISFSLVTFGSDYLLQKLEQTLRENALYAALYESDIVFERQTQVRLVFASAATNVLLFRGESGPGEPAGPAINHDRQFRRIVYLPAYESALKKEWLEDAGKGRLYHYVDSVYKSAKDDSNNAVVALYAAAGAAVLCAVAVVALAVVARQSVKASDLIKGSLTYLSGLVGLQLLSLLSFIVKCLSASNGMQLASDMLRVVNGKRRFLCPRSSLSRLLGLFKEIIRRYPIWVWLLVWVVSIPIQPLLHALILVQSIGSFTSLPSNRVASLVLKTPAGIRNLSGSRTELKKITWTQEVLLV